MKFGEVINDQAFLIQSTRYGDHHRILSFLTAAHGRVDLIAYGAAGAKPRFGGALDFLNILELEFQVTRGDLGRLLQCNLLASQIEISLATIKCDYQRTALVLTWLKLLAKIIPRGGGQDLDLFSLFKESIFAVAQQPVFYSHVIFLKKLLSQLGYFLDLSKCHVCQSIENSPFYFYLEGASLHCSQCLSTDRAYRLSQCLPQQISFENFSEELHLKELELLLLQGYQYFLGIECEHFEHLVA